MHEDIAQHGHRRQRLGEVSDLVVMRKQWLWIIGVILDSKIHLDENGKVCSDTFLVGLGDVQEDVPSDAVLIIAKEEVRKEAGQLIGRSYASLEDLRLAVKPFFYILGEKA